MQKSVAIQDNKTAPCGRQRSRRGFFFIWGSRTELANEGLTPGPYKCTKCGLTGQMYAKSSQRIFTFFFIPTFPMGDRVYFVQCPKCHAQFRRAGPSGTQSTGGNGAGPTPRFGMAVTAFIVSLGSFVLICLGPLASIPAIILGSIAYSKARNKPAEFSGRGMALASIFIGIGNIVFSVAVILLFLFLPGLMPALHSASHPPLVSLTPQKPATRPPSRPVEQQGSRDRQLPPGAEKTVQLGGNGGSPFIQVNAAGKPMLGVHYVLADWGGRQIVRELKALFDTTTKGDSTTILAKDGYVVGGMIVNSDNGTNGFQLIFMRMNDGKMDIHDRYTGDWIGGNVATSETTQLAGKGEIVLGFFGRKGMNQDAIGLVVIPVPSPP